jgi:hypothetical protein
MRLRHLIPLLFLATSALAFDPPLPSPRPIFPDDYKPQPCAPIECKSFELAYLHSSAARFLGLNQASSQWFADHEDELVKAFEPYCAKRNTCIATPGNAHMYCDDTVSQMARDMCNQCYPKEKGLHDWEQCNAWLEAYMLGMTQNSLQPWRDAQECSKQKAAGTMHDKPMDLWIVPDKIPADYNGWITFYAIDPDTHVPVFGHITFEGQGEPPIYAPSNPTGETATTYPFKAKFKLVRVPNAEGHTDVIPPLVTVKNDYYPTLTFRLPMPLSKMIVEMKPGPDKLHTGENTVTFFAHDSETGKPVEARIVVGGRQVGDTNLPIILVKKKHEKLPEIWATSLYDRYSDVVVVPAGK